MYSVESKGHRKVIMVSSQYRMHVPHAFFVGGRGPSSLDHGQHLASSPSVGPSMQSAPINFVPFIRCYDETSYLLLFFGMA